MVIGTFSADQSLPFSTMLRRLELWHAARCARENSMLLSKRLLKNVRIKYHLVLSKGKHLRRHSLANWRAIEQNEYDGKHVSKICYASYYDTNAREGKTTV